MSGGGGGGGPVLRVSRCTRCGLVSWPPAGHCSGCLARTEPADGPRTGVVVEYSRRDGTYFCVADFGGARMMCAMGKGSPRPPEVGMRVRLARGMRGGDDGAAGRRILEIVPA